MARLLWPLALGATFLVGLGTGTFLVGTFLVRKPPAPVRPEAQLSSDAVRRLEQQVETLQARLRAREGLRAAPPASAGDLRAAAGVGPGSAGAWGVDSFAGRGRRAERGGERSGSGRDPVPGEAATERRPGRAEARAAGSPPATVEAAMERFYQYLEASSGGEGQGRERWRKVRELVEELRAMGEVGAQALMNVLASGSDSDERRAAARLLGAIQAPQALPVLRDVLEREDDVLLRRAAAAGLRRLQTPESLPVLERLVANPNEDRFVRLSAAYGLAESGRPQGITGLTRIFDESSADGRGREMAFRALTSLNDERSLPFMRRLVTSQTEPGYRLQAIRFLSAQGDRGALAALQVVMQSPNEQASIRDAAIQAHAVLSGR